jgi:hypothetical protein
MARKVNNKNNPDMFLLKQSITALHLIIHDLPMCNGSEKEVNQLELAASIAEVIIMMGDAGVPLPPRRDS